MLFKIFAVSNDVAEDYLKQFTRSGRCRQDEEGRKLGPIGIPIAAPLRRRRDQLDLRPSLFRSGKYYGVFCCRQDRRTKRRRGKSLGLAPLAQRRASGIPYRATVART